MAVVAMGAVVVVLLLSLPALSSAAAPGPVVPAVPTVRWHLVNSSRLTPPSRQSGSMVYDPAAHEDVLFGGYAGGGALGDTWVFSKGQWTNLSAGLRTAPAARWYYSMVWDPAVPAVVLFGGRNASTDFNDTWTFNGSAWTDLNLTVAPPPMTSGRAAYYPSYDGVFLYGGYSIMPGTPSVYNSSWLFAHGVWTNVTSRVTGAPPDPHVVTFGAYDATSGKILYLGGPAVGNSACSVPSYTWSFANGRFRNLTSKLSGEPPLGAGSRMMTYVAPLGGIVVYGGWDGPGCPAYSSETWLFHHGGWVQLGPVVDPGTLWDGAMATNPTTGSTLLFSGNTLTNTGAQSTSTWRLVP